MRLQSSHCEACDFEAVIANLDHGYAVRGAMFFTDASSAAQRLPPFPFESFLSRCWLFATGLLLQLALGDCVVVHDCASRDMTWPEDPAAVREDNRLGDSSSSGEYSSGGSDIGDGGVAFPRAIWWGLEWSRYALRYAWELNADGVDGGFDGAEAGGRPKERAKKAKAPSQWSLRGYPVDALFEQQYRALPKSLLKRLKYYRPFVAAGGTEVGARLGASSQGPQGDRMH
jgi:hypothetical protein